MRETKRKKGSTLIGEILISHGVLTFAQLHEALCKQWDTGRKIGEVLQDLGFVTMSQLNAALTEQQWRRQQRADSEAATDPGS